MKTRCDICGRTVKEVGVIKRLKGSYYKGKYVGHLKLYVCKYCQKEARKRKPNRYWVCELCGNKVMMPERPIHCLACGGGWFREIDEDEYYEEDTTLLI